MPLPLRPSGGGRPSPRAADALVAGAVLLVVAVWTLVAGLRASEPPLRAALGWALVLAGCGALYFRRRRPVATAVVTLLACAVYYPLSAQDGPLMIAFALALYTTAAEGRFAAAVALGAVTLLAVGAGEIRQQPGHRQIDDTSLAMLAGWLISLVAVGRAQRTRAAYLHEVEQRALAAEREQEARARQSAAEERLRIAREVHDVLGHSISLINVQSGAALHRLGKKPAPEAGLAAATEALEAVRATSKDALRELRATLGVLRRADEPTPTTPASSGLALLGDLAERARSAGLDVRTGVTGAPAPLPPPVDLAAYRIVQESLTNIARHARARTVDIGLDWGPDAVRLRIADDGEGAPEDRPLGSGIRGMAERARALGGELTAGNGRDGGFLVDARLPYAVPSAPGEGPRENTR
ncbi:two-component sensor histidine kinase [Streptomyces cinereoruber]|uniref:histidine kinase n=1 Tax=Streptomyces cinereoruber TaxID=67260 RepID=A0AAV4KRP3_9ACTN|nr:sensor histidine kinase [Streptomyces cinereoruber]MBB4162271.1 signal transduction histidine kinase [Streptomyces cinereoruber]MBY8820314.1 sensor histidine kinase [Streptomyces cinereoruber]NIH58902.1 signal transduction histidine kinase [Streptomyces cinereoruber]QEV35125.1 sensor histidine kinase [Streptomyces cinereoruber]GGR48802.1 two-component sensor histidine kinase [Streptomyces cinereoruber]